MNELDLLVENYFTDSFDASDLFRLVEQVMGEDSLTEMAQLGYAHMSKAAGRFRNFIKKIETRDPFTLGPKGKKGQVILKRDKELIRRLNQMLDSGKISAAGAKEFGVPQKLEAENGQSYSISQLFKEPLLGGEDPHNRIKKELMAQGQLDDLIQDAIRASATDGIVVKILSRDGTELKKYDDVVGVKSQPKVGGVDPKADFQLVRKGGKTPIYISHKDGTTARSFGQWSGVTAKAGERIHTHPEVVQFIEDLKQRLETDESGNYIYPQGVTFARVIQDENLRGMSLFGPDYSISGDGSANNVDIIAQGEFRLETEGVDDKSGVDGNPQVEYTLSADHMMVRGEAQHDFGPEYAPVIEVDEDEQNKIGVYTPALVTRFATARNNFKIRGLRATIYPIGGRKIEAEI